MTATSPAEWLAAGSLGLSAISLIGLALAFVDADLADFDPRPPLARLVESGAVDPLLIVVGPLLADVRTACRTFSRDVGLTLAALLILTIPTGSTR